MSLIKDLDKAWSQAVKIRAGYKCEISGLTKHQCKLNSHHIVGKRNFTLRWDLRNGICVSSSKHTLARQSLHQDPEWARQWLLENRKEDFEYLESKKNMITKRTHSDKKELLKELRAYIRENIDNGQD
jgi:hypothetical protein